MLFNSHLVKNKRRDIHRLIDTHKAGIMALTETRLFSCTDSDAYMHNSFSKFVSHRQQPCRGAGVMCLVRCEFNAVEITKPSNFPVTCIILHLRSLASIIIILYRPLSCTVAETINLIVAFEETLALVYRTAIIGDMNFPARDWLDDPPSPRIESSKAFVGMCAAWNLAQIVQGPIGGSNRLDLILATDTSAFTNSRINLPISSSHHCLEVCNVMLPQRIRANYAIQRIIDYVVLQKQLHAFNWPVRFAATVDVTPYMRYFPNPASQRK